jgi:phospho-N-acetylmuramoyl-pentapeptide-transferase
MFYWLVEIHTTIPVLNPFRYITLRTGGAMVTAALFVFLFGPWIINHLRPAKGQPIHPLTRGGLMILSGLVVSSLLWANLHNAYVWIVLAVTLGFGFIGFYDDYLKATKQTQAFSGRTRLLIESLVAAAACFALIRLGRDPSSGALVIPIFVLFGAFIVVGAGNAVNQTDGLDGLAIVPVMIALASIGLICYLAGNAVFSNYLQISYVAGSGELAVLCGAVLGAGLGFLWFNAPPARIFMGDTGSLALGAMLGSIAVTLASGGK